jgi:hypothetical protein
MSFRGTMSTRLNRQQFGARACVLPISIMLVTTQGLGQGQQRSAENSGEDQTASQKHESLDQKASSSCSAKVPDIDPSANPKAKYTVSKESFTYTPLSSNCKFHLFVKQTYSPYTFASAGFEATWAQATAQWPQYGGGMAGFGKRFGSALADTESRRFIQSFALSTILHQDPRYFPSARRTLVSRAWYAATRVVVTKNDDGRSTLNSSEFLGALFTSALQNSYYPRHYRTCDNTMTRFEGALSSDATTYLLREFTPDLKRLFQKHAPRAVQRIEERLPIPTDDKP